MVARALILNNVSGVTQGQHDQFCRYKIQNGRRGAILFQFCSLSRNHGMINCPVLHKNNP